MPANFYAVQELRRNRSQAIASAREVLEVAHGESRDLNAEEQQQWDGFMSEADNLRTRIEREERMIEAEGSVDGSGSQRGGADPDRDELPEEHRDNPLATAEYRGAFNDYLRLGPNRISAETQRALQVGSAERRATTHQVDDDESGGILVAPPQFLDELLKEVDDETFVRDWARTFQADALGTTTLEDDFDDFEWTTELKRNQTVDTLRFGKRSLQGHPLRKRTKISRQLVRRAPRSETIVRQRVGYKQAVTLEKATLLGDGVRKPLGVFVPSADGISVARDVQADMNPTSVTSDGLINCKFALKTTYWSRARWLFHRDTGKQIAKLKDNEGQYIWRESMRAGEPDMLLGRPMALSEFCPNTHTADAYVGILGDWRYYWILDPISMTIQVLYELYAEEGNIGYIAESEGDGQPVLEEAFVRVQLASS